MHITPYRQTDRVEILKLQQSTDADLGAEVPADFYDDLNAIESSYDGGAFLVAESEAGVVGMGGLLSTGEIVRVRVSGEHRRRGVASQLLSALLAEAATLGLHRVFLHTLSEQVGAQKLYLANGFAEIGRGEVHGNSVIGYERILSTSGA